MLSAHPVSQRGRADGSVTAHTDLPPASSSVFCETGSAIITKPVKECSFKPGVMFYHVVA